MTENGKLKAESGIAESGKRKAESEERSVRRSVGEDPARTDVSRCPVPVAQFGDHYAFGGACVNELSAARVDAHMGDGLPAGVEEDQIAGLQIIIVNLGANGVLRA